MSMPYNHIEELPTAMKKNLPKDAMEVYLAAYNQAWSRSAHARDQRIGATVEDIAHREAWGVVREKYRKKGQEWIRIYG
jgi:cation transport regulator